MRVRALKGTRAQSASLVAIGAFGAHQLWGLLAHGYLGHAAPLLLGVLLAALIARLLRSMLSSRPADTEREVKAISCAAGIAAVLCCQELTEGVLAAAHAAGLTTIFSAGGWAALPLAALYGALAALIDRGIEAIEARAVSVQAPTPRAPFKLSLPPAPGHLGRRLSPLALGLAERPPPLRLS